MSRENQNETSTVYIPEKTSPRKEFYYNRITKTIKYSKVAPLKPGQIKSEDKLKKLLNYS